MGEEAVAFFWKPEEAGTKKKSTRYFLSVEAHKV